MDILHPPTEQPRRNDTSRAVFVGAVVAGLAIAVPAAVIARFDFRRFPDVKRAYEQMHEVKRASSNLQCTTSDFVFNAVQEKLRNMDK